mmetsp:Transcript_11897/g.34025  ORF Transcript_11897/g.34025 Transcript_11897/m.34025 type:complete len:219 (+) Transcript_11897:648-1304(+)
MCRKCPAGKGAAAKRRLRLPVKRRRRSPTRSRSRTASPGPASPRPPVLPTNTRRWRPWIWAPWNASASTVPRPMPPPSWVSIRPISSRPAETAVATSSSILFDSPTRTVPRTPPRSRVCTSPPRRMCRSTSSGLARRALRVRPRSEMRTTRRWLPPQQVPRTVKIVGEGRRRKSDMETSLTISSRRSWKVRAYRWKIPRRTRPPRPGNSSSVISSSSG